MKGFIAYPSQPSAIGQCIQAAAKIMNENGGLALETWEEIDNWGRPLIAPILQHLGSSDVVLADITRLNFNVTFEVGYAIGSQKRVLLLVNGGLTGDEDKFSRIGIYDTLGYAKYENSEDLVDLFSKQIDQRPISFTKFRDTNAPWFVLETPARTDAMARIVARVKATRLRYRSFTTREESRLPAVWAIEQVARSMAVVVPLCASHEKDAAAHNVRAAFVAGLARGMQRRCIILQADDGPAPLDVRDDVTTFRDVSEIDGYIDEVGFYLHDQLRHRLPEMVGKSDILADLSIGDPMAENEFATLGSYYLRTDQFARARRGEVNLVTGRKGTGKTALFSQLRDDVRRFSENVVVDLKPEGYQLIKLKERVLEHLSTGSRDHLVSAFWEYLLYMELAYKLLEKDQDKRFRDPVAYERYEKLRQIYEADRVLAIQGDFSERLSSLADALSERYAVRFAGSEKSTLSRSDVTELLHSGQIRHLRSAIEEYLSDKGEVWILFDNVDKGWSTEGISEGDVFVLRCLLEASRTMRNDVRRVVDKFNSVVFVRNDVYQLLVRKSPDFGKETFVDLDWSDPQMLRDVLLRRIAAGLGEEAQSHDGLFDELCVGRFRDVDTVSFMIDMSLMRPRNLIKIFNYCRGVAVNRGHVRIEEDDIEEGLRIFSDDVLSDLSNELRDICIEADDLLYRFIAEKSEFKKSELSRIMEAHGIPETMVTTIIEYLLYYGAFGIRAHEQRDTFIFDVRYDMKKMKMLAEKFERSTYVMHPSLRPALSVGW